MRVAIYARVSTSDQRCAIQLENLRHYADARDWDVYDTYTDTMSGSAARRPGRDRLMQDAEAGRFECVLVTKLDRWGRSTVDVIETIQRLTDMGVRWIAVDQNLDTDKDNPVGRLLLQLLAAVAEFERSLIRERVKAGLAHAREHGTRSGRPIGGRESVWDRQHAYEDRMGGATWAWLTEKYQVPYSTLRDGIIRYARTMELPPPPIGDEFKPDPARKVPGSGKKPLANWKCEFCGHTHENRAALRRCCPDARAARNAKFKDSEYMKGLRAAALAKKEATAQ